jgi:hypothetical protein
MTTISNEIESIVNNIPSWEYYSYNSSNTNIRNLINEEYKNNNSLIKIFYLTNTQQFILTINEQELYSIIKLCELNISNYDYADWKSDIYLAEDNSIWNDKSYIDSKLFNSYNLIFSNPNILKIVLFELYELLNNKYSSQFINKIIQLLKTNNKLQEQVDTLTEELKKLLNKTHEY